MDYLQGDRYFKIHRDGQNLDRARTQLTLVADMERKRIAERTAAGRDAARESLAKTGKTHKGKTSMGRPSKADAQSVAQWRADNKASITKTAEHWGISPMTVSRYCAAMK